MKFRRRFRILGGAMTLVAGMSFTSCNFLDIVPPEQPGLDDATMNVDETLGFIQSCYAGIKNPIDYRGLEASVDEYAEPPRWAEDNSAATKCAYDLNTPQSLADNRWDRYYEYIGRTHLFLQELPDAKGVSDIQRAEWEAEAYFLLAYYHFQILRLYGPCPINDRYYPQDISASELPGRYHYDYVTDWIVKTLDEKVIGPHALPDVRDSNDRGRATHIIAMAVKAQALLYAASPLWNGKFPYPDWKNENFETPGYGKELVSKEYSEEKWIKAEKACQEVLDAALAVSDGTGPAYRLYGSEADDLDFYASENVPLNNLYIPGNVNDDFRKRVVMLQYMMSMQYGEGNHEFVWGLNNGDDSFISCSLPQRVVKNNNGTYFEGWSGISPYLGAVERFYTANGKLPKYDPNFYPEDEWLTRAGDPQRPDIIKLNVNREPRFYAWLSYDGGDHGFMISNGSPLTIDLKSSKAQGYDPDTYDRRHNVTGFLSQKYLRPNLKRNTSNSWNTKNYPRPLIRMAELYLNLAECEAALGQNADAMEHLNEVRRRAGIAEVTVNDIDESMTLTDWVHNERFIEFFEEGIRYFDLRRWVEGPEYLAEGKREGLNPFETTDPSFEQFNQRVKINQPYRWANRMYLYPIDYYEVTSNPQLVQAPGFGF